VSALDRKLLRDLVQLRGQVITIALVVAAGVASWVCLRSAYASLDLARDAYFERQRLGDVFVHLERAPLSLADRIEAIDGVTAVYPRLVETASLPIEGMPEPALAQLVSIPDEGLPPMNGLDLVEGRLPDPAHADEALLLEQFASRRGIRVGASLPAVMEGRLRTLRIVGIAMSPEFVFAVAPGAMTVEETFTVIWMRESALAAPYRMEGAFDDAVVRLQPGASEPDVIAAIDRLLAPYGTNGAIPRRLQSSAYFVDGELVQLEAMATVSPLIFLGVAAFLLHVVLARLVHLQRGEIAVLKAIGYTDLEVGSQYVKLVLAIVAAGSLLGVAAGAWLGSGMIDLYAEYFRFPGRTYRLTPDVVAIGVLVSAAAAGVGALGSVRHIARLPPAEAMQPPAPGRYRATWLSRGAIARLFETSGRMVLRELERRPLRALVSSVGIAMAIAILVVGRFAHDGLENLIETQFQLAMREDLAVSFASPRPERAVRELGHLPGVERAEGIRTVAARARVGPRSRDIALIGHAPDHRLRALVDSGGREVSIPADGVLVTSKLAEILGARTGDDLSLSLLEGDRATRSVHVAGLVAEPYGLFVHGSAETVRALLREEPRVSSAVLRVDPRAMADVQERLRDLPQVIGVTRRQGIVDSFRQQSGRSMATMTLILSIFAVIVSIGVVYNNARIALSVRERELASLRVLGFTRGEVSAILLGELGAHLALAIPIGLAVGTWLSHLVMATVDAERYRMPVVVSAQTYAFAVTVAIVAGVASALLVRRRLDRLDLVAVLKSRE
jgi:putative ABC transport system permease protein